MPFITDDQENQQGQAQTQGQGSIVGQNVSQGSGQNQTAGSNSSTPQTVSNGASGTITGSAGGGTGAQGATPAGQPQSSGSYTNLQDYLNANQDNAATLGQNVGNQIRSVGNDATSAISNASNQFGQAVQSNTLANLSNAGTDTSNILSDATGLKAGQSLSGDDTSRFQAIANANYAGPKDFQSANVYQPAADAVSKVQSESGLANSDSGRYALLQSVFNRPDYTTGQNNLDNLLLNGSQTGRQQLQQAQQDVSGIGQQFQTAQTQAAATAQQIAEQTAAAKSNAVNSFVTDQTNQNKAVQTRLDDVKSHWGDQYDNLMTALSGYNGGRLNLSTDQAQQLGLNQGDRLYNMLNGIAPSQYITQGTYDAQKEITGDEQNRLAALDQLAGLAGQKTMNQYNDPTQAGTQTLANAVDATQFNQQRLAREAAFNAYAAGTTEVGTGSGARDNIVAGVKLGESKADQTYKQKLSDYLNGNQNVGDKAGGTYSWNFISPYEAFAADMGKSGKGRAEADANSNAYAALQNAISQDLQNQGYNNTVNTDPNAPNGNRIVGRLK